jgi:hypothetical protein
MMLNHPEESLTVLSREYGLDDFGGDTARWVTSMGQHARLIQIINGPGMNSATNANSARPKEEAYLKFLNLGYKLAPTADQDNHKTNWGNATNARTGAVMTSLTKANLIGALRNRHVYATEDPNLSVITRINNRLSGDVISPMPAAGELSIRYEIADADEPDAEYEIQVWRDAVGGPLARMVSSVRVSGGSGAVEDVAFSGEPQFFFFKIIQRSDDGDEDRVWTAPVWFENQPTLPVPQPDTSVGTAIASRHSEVFHISAECLDARRIRASNRVTGAAARQGRRQHEGCPRRSQN